MLPPSKNIRQGKEDKFNISCKSVGLVCSHAEADPLVLLCGGGIRRQDLKRGGVATDDCDPSLIPFMGRSDIPLESDLLSIRST